MTGKSGLPDKVTYDALTVLHNKLEAIHAYDDYIRDAEQAADASSVRLIESIRDADRAHARRLWAWLTERTAAVERDISEDPKLEPTPIRAPGGL